MSTEFCQEIDLLIRALVLAHQGRPPRYEQPTSMEPTLTVTVGRRQRATKLRYGLMRIFDRKTLQ